ncbi:tRNA preQ1(34) S-adenosylmethionine ribosyltransferase-isomerase QueA [Aerosakkonema sp. BLCC-F183]|uniref:tRNA preQ1(34) S-adenosylmethionine ribosyltransferase-isomerase QueA n=1 Tax=Aerosakkonema sp. BLCC-F183 TaxID=3342834 RepID=UPI0035B8E30E
MPNKDEDLFLSAYDYQLPEERIAQNPAIPRDSSRLLVVNSPSHHSHHIFRDLPNLLKSGDLLVLNNTRTIPARLYGRKISGTAVEVLLLEELENNSWLALVKPGKRLPPGTKILFEAQQPHPQPLPVARGGENGEDFQFPIQNPKSKIQNKLTATVVARDEATGGRILQFELPPRTSLIQVLGQFGHVPLPPYIKNSQSHPEQYQTVYGERPGAIAAPTAGLHFTTELLKQLQEKGIEQAYVTLHVGVGTFRPVEAEDITAHKMHSEWVEVSPETVAKIRTTQRRGGRVIAVGTTVVRSLEGAAVSGELQPFCGKTELFIYPGYKWRVVEGLITNFHLPRSSLLMLLSAMIGRDRLLSLYREAIACEYRFYSFGDAMLILPEAKPPN